MGVKGLADKLIPLDSLSMQENQASFSFEIYEPAKITFSRVILAKAAIKFSQNLIFYLIE